MPTQKKLSRIGLFGGSFDPIHQGHLLVAMTACEELLLDRLFFVPAAQSPFKPERQPTADPDRLRLLRLALAGYPHYQIDDQELQRGGISYTVDTVRQYKRQWPASTLFILIGADHARLLPTWRDSGELARLAEFAVIPRPGQAEAALPEPFRFHILKGFPVGISSSEIRARARQGLSLSGLVPDPVAEAIRNYKLYL